VGFFHLDCPSNDVRINADLHAATTVPALGCYRWLVESADQAKQAKASPNTAIKACLLLAW
jgi:hypothetical protein